MNIELKEKKRIYELTKDFFGDFILRSNPKAANKRREGQTLITVRARSTENETKVTIEGEMRGHMGKPLAKCLAKAIERNFGKIAKDAIAIALVDVKEAADAARSEVDEVLAVLQSE